MTTTRFANRHDAGRHLARELQSYANRDDVRILALPRGGVPVAAEVSADLGVPFDVFIVRKLGVPGHEEYAMGAIASGETIFLNHEALEHLQVADSELRAVIEREKRELKRREELYRKNRPPLDLQNKVVILIDDGLATGSTMRAAVAAVRQHRPGKVVVAVPVAAASTCREFERVADEIVCLVSSEMFYAVGQWYEDFSQTTDDEVRELLAEVAQTQ
jgi:putative phosphoribosyl transferase